MVVKPGQPGVVGNLLDIVSKKPGSCAVALEYEDTSGTDCLKKYCPTCGAQAHYCDLSCGYCTPPQSWIDQEDKFENCFANLHAGVLDVEDTCLKPDP